MSITSLTRHIDGGGAALGTRPAEYVNMLKRCLAYRIEGPYIVIENKCSESIEVAAIEVKYYITLLREEEEGYGRREITERLTIGKRIGPSGVLDIYFGPVNNITTVSIVVRYADGEYRVELGKEVGESGQESKTTQ
jgi:hypothetical protein